jgi:hypothetical protein
MSNAAYGDGGLVRRDLPVAESGAPGAGSTSVLVPSWPGRTSGGQTATFQIPSATRSDATLGGQPPCALLAIRARLGCRGGDELATGHRRPEHLHNLRDHPVRKPRHRLPPFTRLPGRDLAGPGKSLQLGGCCDHRADPRAPSATNQTRRFQAGNLALWQTPNAPTTPRTLTQSLRGSKSAGITKTASSRPW